MCAALYFFLHLFTLRLLLFASQFHIVSILFQYQYSISTLSSAQRISLDISERLQCRVAVTVNITCEKVNE